MNFRRRSPGPAGAAEGGDRPGLRASEAAVVPRRRAARTETSGAAGGRRVPESPWLAVMAGPLASEAGPLVRESGSLAPAELPGSAAGLLEPALESPARGSR